MEKKIIPIWLKTEVDEQPSNMAWIVPYFMEFCFSWVSLISEFLHVNMKKFSKLFKDSKAELLTNSNLYFIFIYL